LEVATVRTGPSGLTLLRRLNSSGARTKAEVQAMGEFQDLTWEYYMRRRHAFLETIPNQREAVSSWLHNRP
jgi:hypothetical protein